MKALPKFLPPSSLPPCSPGRRRSGSSPGSFTAEPDQGRRGDVEDLEKLLWVCQSCRSMNEDRIDHCYRCHLARTGRGTGGHPCRSRSCTAPWSRRRHGRAGPGAPGQLVPRRRARRGDAAGRAVRARGAGAGRGAGAALRPGAADPRATGQGLRAHRQGPGDQAPSRGRHTRRHEADQETPLVGRFGRHGTPPSSSQGPV